MAAAVIKDEDVVERFRELAARRPARDRLWDYMSGTAIDKKLGIDILPKSTILSGIDALDFLAAEIPTADTQNDEYWEGLECECEEIIRKYNSDAPMPDVKANGTCDRCGCPR